jgi:hypothetical protein
MPFLHWDLVELQSRRADLIKGARKPASTPKENATQDEKLIAWYLNDAHPLHVRRTLDQYYYHTLADTTERDEDQLANRFQAARKLEPKVLTMVDQLWLWVLKGGPEKPDVILTCFPHIGQDTDADPEGVTNVLRCIKLSLKESWVESAHDLAGLIAATCSGVYLDPASNLNMRGAEKTTLQFSELYGTEIGDVVGYAPAEPRDNLEDELTFRTLT